METNWIYFLGALCRTNKTFYWLDQFAGCKSETSELGKVKDFLCTHLLWSCPILDCCLRGILEKNKPLLYWGGSWSKLGVCQKRPKIPYTILLLNFFKIRKCKNYYKHFYQKLLKYYFNEVKAWEFSSFAGIKQREPTDLYPKITFQIQLKSFRFFWSTALQIQRYIMEHQQTWLWVCFGSKNFL